MKLAVTLVLVGCAGHAAPPTPDAPPASCTAAFTGNFAETDDSPASCPTFDGSTLAFAVQVISITAELDVSIGLPAAMPGNYSCETVPSWSAMAFERETNGGCIYRAGSAATPAGNFTLSLTALAPPHGSLALLLPILTEPGSTCGLEDIENVTFSF
ncbi:MAG TPA: hypothetical protein VGL61_30635 [Kofleriaceae bacterium]|jgi:hypothetical protein